MDPNLFHQHSQREPLAPVGGGLRWRRPYHDIVDQCRGRRGFVFAEPDAPPETEDAPQAEPGLVLPPHIVSTPPGEARVGVEYIYAARAQDGIADGFTWSVAEGPPGVKIDRHTGKMSWTPTEGGYVEVVLCARSVYGKMARQGWTICVRKAVAVRAFTPHPRLCEALRRKTSRIAPAPIRFLWRAPRRPAGVHSRPTGPPGIRPRVAFPLRV